MANLPELINELFGSYKEGERPMYKEPRSESHSKQLDPTVIKERIEQGDYLLSLSPDDREGIREALQQFHITNEATYYERMAVARVFGQGSPYNIDIVAQFSWAVIVLLVRQKLPPAIRHKLICLFEHSLTHPGCAHGISPSDGFMRNLLTNRNYSLVSRQYALLIQETGGPLTDEDHRYLALQDGVQQASPFNIVPPAATTESAVPESNTTTEPEKAEPDTAAEPTAPSPAETPLLAQLKAMEANLLQMGQELMAQIKRSQMGGDPEVIDNLTREKDTAQEEATLLRQQNRDLKMKLTLARNRVAAMEAAIQNMATAAEMTTEAVEVLQAERQALLDEVVPEA